ncbi:hypothetical protein [uncultured Helicobacter sp.]|uniref:hypothetical protein n=1 Tax=uncultured Helicobacter sp. TaxID=175537 RepID=UPI0026173EBD|nr:hypothetical protein [uncultured Helicobacter sp.]
MSDIFRVCIMGRYYDIPTSEISTATLESLKSLADESNNINPRDLLRTFLEYSEINNVLKTTILEANLKMNSNPIEFNNPQEIKEAKENIESPSNNGEYTQLSRCNDVSTQVKSN